MSTWDINPDGVNAVLKQVFNHAGGEDGTGGLAGTLTDTGEHMTNAAKHANSFPVNTALAEFADHFQGPLENMTAKTASAIDGCATATRAYTNGNLEMAAEAQKNAGTVTDPDL
ncbi:hypothetical protein HNR23_004133 [Nocardiopsis mwathae]|uniref:ESX-1 secretion-associated protein n=1 Tax=Nocardiopsis mwathae TaxID=1472723 RepID=A0A7W9YKY0_9ACTN|nr:DUF6507 family protein [Nocardiopsis mwathae]MBB6174073.1 hypothetical protein [Nocardiopsis mwathae]